MGIDKEVDFQRDGVSMGRVDYQQGYICLLHCTAPGTTPDTVLSSTPGTVFSTAPGTIPGTVLSTAPGTLPGTVLSTAPGRP